MKVKSHQTSSTSRSESPAVYSQQIASSDQDTQNSNTNPNNWSDSTDLLMSPGHFVTPTNLNSSQIWTRSAVRAAQLQKQNDISPCHRQHKHHGQSQHALGKIVKPIPVRPMSSSSSSSSTHSSQFSSNFHSKSMHSNLSSHNNNTASSVISSRSDSGQNFSLIAKYFASFPATRLAKTNSQIFSENDSAHYSLPKSTPFLPFKKANTIKSNHTGYSNDNIQSTFVLRSQTNGSQQQMTNTDHLCTNFRRMIKLNDPESPFFTNIRNTSPAAGCAASGEQNNTQFNSINFSQNEHNNSLNQHTFQLPINNQDAINSCFSAQSNLYDINASNVDQLNDDDATTRLGQITMETRSTRKFLIKHHPYLQHSSHSGVVSAGKNLNQRPSINLMKKLNSKSSIHENSGNEGSSHGPINDYTHTNNSSNNRSGRSSRSNNSGLNEINNTSTNDHSLLKFTDLLPAGSNATMKRRQLKSLTTASALCNEINQSKRHTTRSRTNKNFNRHPSEAGSANLNDSGAGEDQCYCEYDEHEENHHLHDETCEDYCCDEQEEDSSGYYSSYHSVDLVSSSGGSCVGGHQVLNRHLETNNWDSSDNNLDVANKSVNSITNHSSNNNSNNNSTCGGTNQIPQHHYQTRYLTHCLEQKQESKADPSINNSSISSSVKNIIQTTSTTSIPTTRLRYQQQLAAQAAKFACDLDLDQIEND